MKSVHIHTITAWGGGENQVLGLLGGLDRAGQEPILFGDQGGALFRAATRKGLDVRPLPGRGPVSRRWNARVMARQLAGSGIDLIHMHDSHAADIGIRLARRLGVPGVLSRRVAFAFRSNPISRSKYSPENMSAIVAVSESVRQVVVRSGYPADRVFVVPSGTNLNEVDGIEPDPVLREKFAGKRLVGGLGRLTPTKNWGFMVRVAALLRQTRADVHWLLAGDGPDEAALRALVHDLDLTDRFHFLGFRHDPVQVIGTLDLLFHPSISEGAPGVIREAMALGVPVLTVDAPGSVEVLGGYGWSIGPADVAGAAGAILQGMSDETKRRQFVDVAQQRVRTQFSMDQTVAGTINVYRGLSEQAHRSSIRTEATLAGP